MDTLVCMGAGVGMAHGAELVGHQGPTVAVIGDSTFVHSGITPLIDLVYNGGTSTVLILDNRTTAMTGRQENPATGRTIMGDAAPALDLEALVRAVGVKDVHVVDPYNMVLLKIVLERAFQHPGPSVVIVQRACVLLDRKTWKPGLVVDEDACLACGICGELGCPGLRPGVGLEEPASIDAALCTGCGECVHVCPFHAIVEHGKETSGQ
jgi:indolepyruvate ferredoxin oxidoreductase alpha subunit